MTPSYVDPSTLHDVWDWVKDGIEHTIRKTGEKLLPEDVYTKLRADPQNNMLIVIYDDQDERRGFVVLQRVMEFAGPALLVWMMWGRLADQREAIYDWLRELKVKQGYRRVWWLSPRRWDAVPGVKRKSSVYELE